MNNVLYTNKYINFTEEPIFFGSGKNSQRYDVVKYPIFDTIWTQMAGNDWVHDEIACTKDQNDFINLTDSMKHVFTRVLNKLIFLDSLQGRGLLQTIGSVITNPEFECCVTEWQRFEISRHSRSYTHILRSIYPNPSKIFDESFKIKELMDIADSISEPYEMCFNTIAKYHLNQCSKDEAKEAILKMFIEINILEGVRFYSGFAAIWSMHYSQGLMERTSKILQLICRDENYHLAITQNLLKILFKNKDEGFVEIYEKLKPYIKERYLQTYEQECVWVSYLFKYGSFLGMTQNLAENYLKYLINKRLKAIGENILFEGFSKNPISWIENYINYDKNEGLPQESELQNYKFDILNQDIDDKTLNNLKEKLIG